MNDFKGEILLFFQILVLLFDGIVEVNFKGEIGSKIIIKIIKKDEIVFLIVFSVEVKVCIEGKRILYLVY